ncbi:hypothetical protein MKW98_023408, partial [Papaver atlanticum]
MITNRIIKRTIREEIVEETPSPAKRRRKTDDDSPTDTSPAAKSPTTRSMSKVVTPSPTKKANVPQKKGKKSKTKAAAATKAKAKKATKAATPLPKAKGKKALVLRVATPSPKAKGKAKGEKANVPLKKGGNKRKKAAGKPQSLYRAGFRGLYWLVKTIKTKEKLKLSKLQLQLIAEASYGNMFLMLWNLGFDLEHWLKLEDAITKMLRYYKRGQEPNKLMFCFVRHDTPHELVSTPEKMALVYGMPRTPNREYQDLRLTLKSGWHSSKGLFLLGWNV